MASENFEGIPGKRMSIVGKRVHALRLARNMSIEDLSKKTSISSVTISNIEKGVYSPKLSTIVEDKTIVLNEGDSLYFHGSYRHSIEAVKASKLIFISVYS